MRYSFVFAAILAIAASTVAQFFDSISSPTFDATIPAGSPFDIVWAPEGVTGTITITLLQGATNVTLNPGPIIKSGINNLDGNYTWDVPTDVGTFATYGLLINLDNSSKSQYSQPFHISGGTAASTTSGSTTTVKLSTGPSYTSTTSSSSTVVPISTSAYANMTTSAVSSSTTSSSNATLASTLTTAKSTKSATKTSSSGASSTSSTTTSTPSSAAVANLASGGFAILGSFVLALAL